MNKFWVVALETYKRNVKSVTFIVMILAPFLMIGFSLLVGLMASKFEETSNIAVISTNQVVRESFVAQSPLDVDENILTVKEAEKALEAEEIDGYLTITSDEKASTVAGEYTGTTSLGGTDLAEINQVLSSVQLALTTQEMSLSAEDMSRLMAPAAFTEKTVEFKDGEMKEKETNQFALTMGAYFIGFAMYMIILMYAQITSTEVASEKGTRIMEIILSSTTAAKHFYGKVMGIFLVIITQVLVYIATGAGAFMIAKDMPMVQDFLKVISVKELVTALFGYNMLYLLFGVLIYTILAALCGSLVSKSEDAGKAAVPVTYITIIGFMINVMFGMSNPQHVVMKVTSFVPFLSSFTMPSRIASGTVSTMSIMVSLAILVVTTLLLLKLSASMYRSTALVYSDQSMWKTLTSAFSFMKSEKK